MTDMMISQYSHLAATLSLEGRGEDAHRHSGMTDAESFWQNPKTERRGGWLKERVSEEVQSARAVISTVEDLEDLVAAL